MINGVKRWPFDVTDAMVPHGENVAFYCKHPHKQCSFTAPQTCFDGKLQPPACYMGKEQKNKTWTTFTGPILFLSVSACQSEELIDSWWLLLFVFQSPRGCSINCSLTGWSQRLKHASLVMTWKSDLFPIRQPLNRVTPPALISRIRSSPRCSFTSTIYAMIIVCKTLKYSSPCTHGLCRSLLHPIKLQL